MLTVGMHREIYFLTWDKLIGLEPLIGGGGGGWYWSSSDSSVKLWPKGSLQKKNGKKDDIMHISNYPLPPCLIVTTERVTNHSNQ